MTRSVWVDVPVFKADAELAQKLGLVYVVLEAINSQGQIELSPREYLSSRDLFRLHKVACGVFMWVSPTTASVSSCANWLKELLALDSSLAPCLVEYDVERPWRKRYLSGYPTMKAAAEDLMAKTREVCAKWHQPPIIGLTTYPFHQECKGKGALKPLVDQVAVQAYSIPTKEGEMPRHPVHFQRQALDLLSLPPDKVVVGQAAWNQEGIVGVGGIPYASPVAAMEAAYRSCEGRCIGQRWWGWKWVKRNKYVRDFLKSLR